MDNNVNCLFCKTKLKGRTDKKFCSPYCKSSYHYQQNKEKEDTRFLVVKNKLNTNRKILKKYNKSGLATVRKEKLLKEGFDANYFTNYWKNKKNEIYLFCFEFGFYEIKNTNPSKYILITWQKYMEK